MENGKMGIGGLIIKVITITFLIFLLKQAYGKEITPEVITTTFPEAPINILDTINRFYEISERSLKVGYNSTIENNSAFKTTIGSRDRYIIANDFSEDSINLIFLDKGETLVNKRIKTNEYIIFKIEDLNLEFRLHSANKSQAQIELKLFEKEIPADADYFELFDIQVRLAEYTIYSPTDLTALIEFTNFGEGPSHVRLIYSIINKSGKEFYTGIDEKIVETSEVVIKNFNTLDIPRGDYIIRTTIYYGKNQEATSENSFTLTTPPKYEIIKQPLIFIFLVATAFAIVIFFKKRNREIETNSSQPSLI